MPNKKILALTSITVFCSAILAVASFAADAKPNVLFIVCDDLNTMIGCYGDAYAKTPNLDKLASRGMLFEKNYCQQPICNPSRASFMSGRRPDTLRIWDIPTNLRDRHPDLITMPQWFKQHGYFAQGIGKIYHNFNQKIQGDPDSWSVPQLMHWDSHTTEKAFLPPGMPVPPNLAKDIQCESRDVPDEAYFDGRIANLAKEALQGFSKTGQPFFLGVGMWKPHGPMNAPKKYWDMYRREEVPAPNPATRPKNAPDLAFHANHEFLSYPPNYDPLREVDEEGKREMRHGYYAAISYVDAQIGKVIDELDRLSLAKNTIIVLTSDHGLQVGEHTSWGKMTLFENDARAPLIIVAPGVTPSGVKTRSISELIDIYPTLVDLCGLPQPAGLDGLSLKPVLSDPTKSVKEAALTQHPRPAIYWRNSQYSKTRPMPTVMGYAMHNDRWCYTEWRDFKTGRVVGQELYDDQKDPTETVNLAGTLEGATIIPALAEQLDTLIKSAKPMHDL